MTKKPTILLISPSPKLAGGIARWTGHIMAYYQHHETNIELELLEVGNLYIPKSGILKPLHRVWRGVKLYFGLIAELKQQLKTVKPDVVHICSSASLSLIKDLFLLRIAKKARVKSVVHFRFGRIPELVKSRNWEWKLLEKVVRMADTTIVIDKTSFDALEKTKCCNNLLLLPNPISDNILEIVSKSGNVVRKEREVVFVGHLIKTKGVFELVEACKQIPDINLKMYGAASDDMKQTVLDRAGENNSWLEIFGEIEYSTVFGKMMEAGVFVLPTYTEGFPNVILESMACGCPIVACGVGAIPEMLNKGKESICGIVIEPKNVAELKSAIEKMLSDRVFAESCGENARKRVIKQYSMKAVWNGLETIWINTIKTNNNV